MDKTWLIVPALALGLGAATAVAAMPAAPAAPELPALAAPPAFDVRPLVAAEPVPERVLSAARASGGARGRVQSTGAAPYEAMIDDFEAVLLDTQKWLYIADGDKDLHGSYFWGLSKCRAKGGTQSLWAVGDGDPSVIPNGRQLRCGDNYPNGAQSTAILALDLTGWSPDVADLRLLFDFWLNTRTEIMDGVAGDGLFVVFVRTLPNGSQEEIVVDALSSEFPQRFWDESREIDLRMLRDVYGQNPNVYNAAGTVALIEFLFVSKDVAGGTKPEGSFIDNVRLEASVPPVTPTPVTPTVGTPGTPVPTTATPTRGPETQTPVPTTVEPTNPPEETGTPDATESATATEGTEETATPTPTRMATPTPTPTMGPKPIFMPITYRDGGAEQLFTPTPDGTGTAVPTQEPVVFGLDEQNGSGVSGQATLIQQGTELRVEITLEGSPFGSHPAHIHVGTCANIGAVAFPLDPVVNGTSVTRLTDAFLAELQGDDHAINLHASAERIDEYIACGDIPKPARRRK